MPWEYIGNCGSGNLPKDKGWIVHCNSLAISYLNFAIGSLPVGCKLGIIWQEHELDNYPSIGLHWDYPQMDPPWNIINRCETLVERFDEAVSWSEIKPSSESETSSTEIISEVLAGRY